MKKLIETADLLENYLQALKNYGFYTDRFDDRISQELKDIILPDNYVLKPWHITHELLKETFINKAKIIEPRFQIDSGCEPVIDLLVRYLREDPDFLQSDEVYALRKGILLMGGVGCGKTTIMRSFMQINLRFENIRRTFNGTPQHQFNNYRSLESYQIAHAYQKSGYEILESGVYTDVLERVYLKADVLFIDDIGSEPVINHFGNTTKIIGEIINVRYDIKKAVTHCTTNLDPKSLKEHYGDRVFSRMKELFNFIHMTGTDRRK
jgi:predicted ATPase